jgi:hypothetical protein
VTAGLWVVAWLSALTAAGAFVTWRAGQAAGLAPATRIAAGWLAGQVLLGATARVLSWAGIPWSSIALLGGTLLLIFAAGMATRRLIPRDRNPGPPRPGRHAVPGVAAAVAALLILAALSVTVRQVRSPLWSNDAIAIWALKAKVLTAQRGIDPAALGDPGFDFTHPEYPLLWPVTMAAPMVGCGFDGWAATLFAPFLTLLLLTSLLGELRQRGLGPGWAGAFGVIFLSFHNLLGPFSVGLAELPFAVALLVSAVAVTRLRSSGGPGPAVLAAVGLTAAVLLKNEGIALLAASAVVLLWPGPQPATGRRLWTLALPAAALAGSLALRRLEGFAVHGDVRFGWLEPGELAARLGQVAGFAFDQRVQPHALLVLALAALVILGRSTGRAAGALGALLALVALAYLPAYLWTWRDLGWHLETTLLRISAPLGVLLLLLVGEHLAVWLQGGDSPPETTG